MNVVTMQLHKRSSYEFKFIQDKVSLNNDQRVYAIADGTTQSFNSEKWAEIITSWFTVNPIFNTEELISYLTERAVDFNSSKFEYSTNPAMASLERTKISKGATSTFLAIKIDNEIINGISCGDSNLFLVNADGGLTAFPFETVDLLDSNNHFINTVQLLKGEIDKTFFSSFTVPLGKGTVLLATDALSRLLLKNPEDISALLSISSFDQLLEFCIRRWDDGTLQEDDISVVIIRPGIDSDVLAIFPPADFSFPKEEELEFVPTSLTQLAPQDPQIMDNQLRNQLSLITREITTLKKDHKLIKTLLLGIIGLLLVIICYSYLKGNKSKSLQVGAVVELQKELSTKDRAISRYKAEIQFLQKKLDARTTEREDGVNREKRDTSIVDTKSKKETSQ